MTATKTKTEPVEPAEPPTETALVPKAPTLSLIETAIAKGIDAEQLGKLMDLHERHTKAIAVAEFNRAFQAFKSEAPSAIKRTGKVGYETKTGGRTSYDHVELDYAVNALVPVLARHGLSHRWETKQDGVLITVTCHLEHELGHSRQATLSGPADTSGSKNPIQAIGSAVTYLERYTFLSVTGMAAGKDDDAGGVIDTLLAAEVAELKPLVDELTDPAAFFQWLAKVNGGKEIASLADLPRKQFKTTKDALTKKVEAIRAANAKAGAA